jgi:hypothetical protein
VGLIVDVESLLSTVSNVYLGSMPSTPDNVVAIYNSGGYTRDLSGTMVEEPTFMIKVRNTSYATGEALCNTIKDLLHGQNAKVIGSGTTARTFLLIEQQGDINDLGRDENNRTEWSLNFRAYYRR